MRFHDFIDRISKWSATPIFQAVNLALVLGNKTAIAFDHRGNLLALIRMNQEYDFIMPHCFSLSVCHDSSSRFVSAFTTIGKARSRPFPLFNRETAFLGSEIVRKPFPC